MRNGTLYFNLSTQEAEAAFGALVEILLKSRLRAQGETAQGFYDEDVNAYLAGVLFEHMDPQYCESVRPVLSDREVDVFLLATRGDDAYRPYWVYKVNADDRLLTLGIFHPQRAGQEGLLAQAKRYYGFAADYHHRRHGRATAVSDILEKLARWTERYILILHEARRAYLHFVEALTAEEMSALHQELERDAHVRPLKVKQDECLDAYSAWRRTSSPEAKARLLRVLDELRRLDPMFHGPSLKILDSH